MYQPALDPHQIRALYVLKNIDGRPMTFHARRAIDEYLERFPEVQEGIRKLEDRDGTRFRS